MTEHRWIKGKYAVSLSKEKQAPYEAGMFDVETKTQGSQIVRKDVYNLPWVAIPRLAIGSMRTDAVLSVSFSRDIHNNLLDSPVTILVCGAGDISIDRPKEVNIRVQNDCAGIWMKNTVFTIPKGSGSAGIRAFSMHSDKVTDRQWLFAGMAEGSIIKAQYDPSRIGLLAIDTARELRGMGRVMAMCECNGDL